MKLVFIVAGVSPNLAIALGRALTAHALRRDAMLRSRPRSATAHRKLPIAAGGSCETERVVYFRKPLRAARRAESAAAITAEDAPLKESLAPLAGRGKGEG